MEWYVYYHNVNKGKIEKYNIFASSRITNEIIAERKEAKTKEDFSERVKTIVRYYFWSKCEWEILLAPWEGDAREEKIDVYDQLRLNWSAFVDYVWNYTEG